MNGKSRCRFLKANGAQCKRRAYFGNFCWQHSNSKKVSIISIICLVAAILTIKHYFGEATEFIAQRNENTLICDRDQYLGCYLDFSENDLIHANDATQIEKEFPTISILKGGFMMNYTSGNKPITELNFPEPHEDASPIKLIVEKGQVYFRGQLKDFKTDEIIGWFDENEFGVVKPCAFSWNKDNFGIEIIDRYGHVVFSIDLIKEVPEGTRGFPLQTPNLIISYKGYHKTNNIYYVYNDDLCETNELFVAESCISRINPIFQHYGSNSLEKRIKK